MRLKCVDEVIQTLYNIGFFEEDGEQEDEQENEGIETRNWKMRRTRNSKMMMMRNLLI